MSDRTGPAAYRLRPVTAADASAVLAAFASAVDMARQGDVVDLATAERYVEWLRGDDRRAFAVAHRGQMVGLVAATLDPTNRNGWVFYWMHAAHRGRGATSQAVAAVADHLLTPGPGARGWSGSSWDTG